MPKGFRPGNAPEEKRKKEAEKEYNKRMEGFLPEWRALSKKWKVGPGAVLTSQPNKIEAVPVWLDQKPLYESKAAKEKEKLPSGVIT